MAKRRSTRKNQQQAMDANLRCLTGLNDLFHLLRESNALIGRMGLCVVIDAQRLPALLANDLHPFMAHSLDYLEFGGVNCVSTASHDDTYMFMEMSPLSEDPVRWDDGTETPAPSNDQVPYIEEVRSLVYAIPEITGSARQSIEVAKAEFDAATRNFFAEHATEIRETLFAGAATDAPPKVLH